MTARLPQIIGSYVEAYNRRDQKAAANCFSKNAVVHDEGMEHRGKEAIGEWIGATTEKYRPLLTVGAIEGAGGETVVAMTVSGSFPGSPVTLAFHFALENNTIVRLDIVP